MPLYEYQCENCGHRFEVIQKYSDAPVSVCPKCGGPVQKLLSSPAIQFKGSGFYLTDYGRGGKTDSASASAGKGEAKAKADGGKSEGTATSKSESSASSSESKPSTATPSKD